MNLNPLWSSKARHVPSIISEPFQRVRSPPWSFPSRREGCSEYRLTFKKTVLSVSGDRRLDLRF